MWKVIHSNINIICDIMWIKCVEKVTLTGTHPRMQWNLILTNYFSVLFFRFLVLQTTHCFFETMVKCSQQWYFFGTADFMHVWVSRRSEFTILTTIIANHCLRTGSGRRKGRVHFILSYVKEHCFVGQHHLVRLFWSKVIWQLRPIRLCTANSSENETGQDSISSNS